MKRKILLILVAGFLCVHSYAQDKISGQWYIGFQHNENTNYNQFHLKRAYITYKKRINPWLSGRITPDITIDNEGDGMGDVEFRMKYLYVQFDIKDAGLFKNNTIKTGLVARPWIDFEQKVISYRAQGHMFLERNKVINSTDFGISFNTSIGDSYKAENFKTACPGRFGYISTGIFNGGGYNNLEENTNKTLEWRVTLRPFPNKFPGLLASYHGAYGHGNSSHNHLFKLNGYHLTYEHAWFVLAAQYYNGIGNYTDSYVDTTNDKPIQSEGYSLFAEFRHPKTGLGFWGRYDSQFKNYQIPESSYTGERFILSAVWRFYRDNKLILSRDLYEKKQGSEIVKIWEATLDIRF